MGWSYLYTMRTVHNLKNKKPRRKVLRNSMTPQEISLWMKLKGDQLGCKFRRQHSIGNFIVDFYCPKAKLIVEIDGSQHQENERYDAKRTEYLTNLGYRVLRFWNNEVNTNMDGVIMKIQEELNTTSTIPSSLPPPRLEDSTPLLR